MSKKHVTRELENVFIWAPIKGTLLNFSELRVFTGSVGKSNVLFHKGAAGLQRLIPKLGREDGFLQDNYLHAYAEMWLLTTCFAEDLSPPCL